jgi:iron-sulfur cluster assembly accessory protein
LYHINILRKFVKDVITNLLNNLNIGIIQIMDIQIKSSRAVLATENAVKKLIELKQAESSDNSFLRMGVKPGGCSGYSYEMFFDTEEFDGDVIEEYGDVNIVVDAQSLEHIKGSTLDYREGLMETGFSIDNPNVSRTCGCGNSFS